MQLVSLDDRLVLESFLRKNTTRHLFEIGDLDDYYWPDTAWYGAMVDGDLRQVAMLYMRPPAPVLMLYGDPPRDEARAFAELLRPELPGRMYAHLGDDLVDAMSVRFRLVNREAQIKMRLAGLISPPGNSAVAVTGLMVDDAAAIERFYATAYPGTSAKTQTL